MSRLAKMPNIKTYCRIKPTTEIYPDYEVTKDTLHLRVPEVIRDVGTVNKSNSVINHAFHFDYIFSIDTSQEDVFDKAAVDIVQGFLSGYNGTIFAYGQTGTGKTYTVEGSAKTYNQRGLEPRALSMIYQVLEKRQDEEIQVHISYMEIYQEVGYDLLNPGARMQSCVTPFPKVTVLEGPSGSWIVRNLSMHLAASEEVAQSLLLQGEANRKVAATTVHDRSSRSHAVFTIQLTAKKPDSDTFVRSKLHLVDLAGSERVSKTGVYGQQLSEAKSINLSLHHLESVIIALQQENINNIKLPGLRSSYANRSHPYLLQRPSSADGYRTNKHIPYRNSLLTMVLRDSLGGNCLTAMIATISLEFENLGETISTCRFAGRVACIANSISRNEQLDEKTLIRKLRKRVAELESELNCLKMEKDQSGEVAEGAVSQLSEADKKHCTRVIQEYLSGRISDPVLAGITDPYKFRECLRILRKLVINGYFGSPVTDPNNNAFSSANQSQPDLSVLNQSEQDLSVSRQEKHNDSNMGLDESIISKSLQKAKHERSQQLSRQASQRLLIETSPYTVNKSRKAWDQPETKDPETLSEMLNSFSKPEKYKSPFEKKRVREIKRLNEKLVKMKTETEGQKKEVTDIKVSLAEQELDLMERSIRTKLDVTMAQVKDQQAFIQQLRMTEADPEILEREKLVEKQLMKRQMKFEKKLEDVGERLTHLRNHVEAQSEDKTKQEASLQEKFGQFKKRDGSLNTRQVFDMLKNEERKQTKTQAQIDREKLLVTSKHLEVKEAATRQKLQELKDMLKQSQVGYPVIINGEPFQDAPEHDLSDGRIPGKGDNALQFMNGHGLGERGHKINMTFVKEKDPDDSKVKSDINGITANSFPENEKRPSSSLSMRSTKSNIPSSEFYAKRKKEKDPDARWESYSRPGTSGGNRADPQPHQGASKSNREEDSVSSHNDSKTQGGSNDKNSLEGTNKYPKSKVDILILDELEEFKEKSVVQDSKSDSKEGVLRLRSDSVEKNSRSRSESREKEPVSGSNSKLTESSTTDELKLESLDEKVKKIEDELLENNKRFELPVSKFDLKTNKSSQLQQTYMPSEYVYNMKRGDEFDGRKMDLKSKNFDSALSAMLNNEKTNMLTMHADYDKYARTNLPKRSSPAHSRHRSHQEHRSKGQEKSHQTSTPTSGDVWGPDAKKSPISEKIRKYLQSPEKDRKFLQEKHKSSPTGTRPRSLEDLSRVNQDPYPAPSGLEIEEDTPRKITALGEKERESSFMNRAQAERDRVARIRQARRAAETIQRAWKRYIARRAHR